MAVMAILSYLVIVGAVLVPLLYTYAVTVVGSSFPSLKNKRICLLIAHPDDEAMFFAPTVLALTRPETGNHVKILCLSTGDADGLGETRKRELKKSGMLLGLKDEDDVFIVDDQKHFPDSMTTTWDETRIANLLGQCFAPLAGRGPSDKPIEASIDVLVTFDSQGVSSHPNHISLYHGARAFATRLTQLTPGWRCPVDVYTLTSVSMPRKYASILDVFATLFASVSDTRSSSSTAVADHPESLVFLSSLFGSSGATKGTAWRAMTEAHESQMRWFRYGWIVLSRYMVINDLKLQTIDSAASTTAAAE